MEGLVMGTRSTTEAASPATGVARRDLNDLCRRLDGDFQRMSGRSLLVTGGAGFLGHYLVQAPLHWNRTRAGADEPVRVVVCDNYLRGIPAWLEPWKDDPCLRLVRHDVTEPLPPGITDVDYAFHAASIASPTYYRKHPIETMDANVHGIRSLLELCRERGVAGRSVTGLVFFSSSEVYGDPDPAHVPTPETYVGRVSFTGPRACYDESKRYGETLCVNFARMHGVPVKIVRPFNNYGPGLHIDDRRVIPDFARDILEGRDLVLLSDGAPTRTFCYVTDAVVGYYRALLRGRAGEPYNIGTESPEVSVTELAERMRSLAEDLFGYRGKIVHRASDDPDYLTDNPSRRAPDITKARAELGYEPEVSLDEGLRRSLRWYAEGRREDLS